MGRGTNGDGSAAPALRAREDTSFTNADPRFRGPAYRYLRPSDKLPTYSEIAGEPDPICKVKLFHVSSRYAYYVAAATNYDGIEGPVLSGYCVSALGPDCDEWGDQDIVSISGPLPPFGLPIEREIGFKPMRMSEIKAAIAADGHC